MQTADLMAPVKVPAFRLDGSPITLTADRFHADRLSLQHAVVDELVDVQGSPVMMIYVDGEGKAFFSDKDNPGVSLPALIFGVKHMVAYKTDDLTDVRMGNFMTRKQRNTYQ